MWLGWGHGTLILPALLLKILKLPSDPGSNSTPTHTPRAISPALDFLVHGAHEKASEVGISSLPQGKVKKGRLMGEMTRRTNCMVQILKASMFIIKKNSATSPLGC